jgi:hypothetical protein
MPEKNENGIDTFVGFFWAKKPVSSGQYEQQMSFNASCLICSSLLITLEE